MFRPEQIANAKFTLVSSNAYKADEVDGFLFNLSNDYAELTAKNEELGKKINILADLVKHYREDEDTIKDTLISAQRMAKTVQNEAEEARQLKLSEAEKEATAINEDAKLRAKDYYNKAKETIDSYKDKAKTDSEAIISAAQTRADTLLGEAKTKSAEIIGDSEKKRNLYTAESEKLKEEIETCKSVLSELCAKQLALLKELPEFEASAMQAKEEKAEPADEGVEFNPVKPADADDEEDAAQPEVNLDEAQFNFNVGSFDSDDDDDEIFSDIYGAGQAASPIEDNSELMNEFNSLIAAKKEEKAGAAAAAAVTAAADDNDIGFDFDLDIIAESGSTSGTKE